MDVRNSGGAHIGWWNGHRGRRRFAAAAVLAAAALLAVACSSGTAPAAARTAAARLTITPANLSRNVQPGRGVSVTAAGGTLASVALSAGSHLVAGRFNTARTAWRPAWPLRPAHDYTLTATADNDAHQPTTRTASFRTVRSRASFQAEIFEGYHQTYGVGIPIMLKFSRPVARKAAVERSLQLWTSKPVVGAWYWDGSESLVFRPRTYWPQHTKIRLEAHLAGVEISRGVYGTADLSQSFRIGNSLIAVVNTASHYAHIYYRNKLFGDWPVSTGSPGDDTADGTYLTIEKGNPVLMSGPGYTNFPVPYSVRFTWSGNYMHDAYWSVGEQGYSNVSHGCVNLSPADAQAYYDLAVPGDPVTITHSPAAGSWDDGWTEWFLSWRRLLRGSATHLAVEAGPGGSRFADPSTLPAATGTPPLGTSRGHNARAA